MANALQFNGTTTKVVSTLSNCPYGANVMHTIEIRFKLNNLLTLQCPIWYGTTGWTGFYVNTLGKLLYQSPGVTRDSNISINSATTYFASMSFNGSTMNQYINGALDATYTTGLTILSPVLNIGKSNSNTLFLNGEIYEVRIWNRARSAEEIALYANCKLTGKEEGLVFYADFATGSGTTLYDLTDNMNHGTITM